MKIRLIITMAVISFLVIAGLYFNSSRYPRLPGQTYKVFLEKGYAVSEKTFAVKKGVIIFEVADHNGFLVQSNSARMFGQVNPWSEVVFITVSVPLRAEIKKLSANKCKLILPQDGKVNIRIQYNPKYFNPLTDAVWTGKGRGGDFQKSPLTVKIRNITTGNYAKGIPDLEELGKVKLQPIQTQVTAAANQKQVGEISKLFSKGILVVKRALGIEPEAQSNQDFWVDKLSDQEIQEIKDRVTGAWVVGEDLIKK